jgi:hypothetical protein
LTSISRSRNEHDAARGDHGESEREHEQHPKREDDPLVKLGALFVIRHRRAQSRAARRRDHLRGSQSFGAIRSLCSPIHWESIFFIETSVCYRRRRIATYSCYNRIL